MAGIYGRLSHKLLALILFKGSASNSGGVSVVFLIALRISLVVFAGAIVLLRWFFFDANYGYRVNYPSPGTYLARVSTRFVDRSATNEVRHMAADRIVGVRVRNDMATQHVMTSISNLKTNGDLSFASSELEGIVRTMSDDVRARVISTTIEIAEKNYDKSTTRSEQRAVIWDNLRYVQMPQSEKNVVFQLLDTLLTPTISENNEMADRLRESVAANIPSITRDIRIGDVIINEGQIVSPETAKLLRENGYLDASVPWRHLSFVIIITFVWSLWMTWIGVRQTVPPSHREWVYVVVLLAINWITQNLLARWGYDSMALLALSGWMFLTLPSAFAFHLVLGGGLIGYILAYPGMTSVLAVGCILCGVAAASFIFMKESASRIMIWRNVFVLGLMLTFASSFVRWGLGLPVSWEIVGLNLLLSAFWSSIVVAIIPLWEYIFDIISPLRLLEMSHPSQPLLKRLQLEAPGTYHHTVTVGTLAEAVADRLGMNGLLVKTGAYYHDIGKLKRPHYFVENQSFGDNIHDRLAPEASARMILNHVTDGLKLADDYKLPRRIKKFIAEHHGTTCLVYFYHKAVAADKEKGGDGSSVIKEDYCYPGPMPQSPDTAILMLADSVDAAMKSLKDPLAGRTELKKLVDDVTNSKIMSGQFVDVDFTMKDISSIKTAMVDALMSMYHSREIKPIAEPGNGHTPPNGEGRDEAPLHHDDNGAAADVSRIVPDEF
jgi:putative nucleotidyltransferase with HDIG domain